MRQVGHLPELYEDARSEIHKILILYKSSLLLPKALFNCTLYVFRVIVKHVNQ
jgi:hypothetical protein